MDYKAKKKIVYFFDDLLDNILIGFFVCLLLIGMYLGGDMLYLFNHAESAKAEAYRPTKENTTSFKEISQDCVGWVKIDDSSIDFPIMQGVDNIEYLNKDPYGDYSLAGSIYLDSRNSSDFSDEYLLLYGHNMEKDQMFGSIHKWQDVEYFNEHKYGTVYCGDTQYIFTAFAFVTVDSYNEYVFAPDTHFPLQFLRENAEIFEEPKSTHLIALSTCIDSGSLRHVLFGYLVKAD